MRRKGLPYYPLKIPSQNSSHIGGEVSHVHCPFSTLSGREKTIAPKKNEIFIAVTSAEYSHRHRHRHRRGRIREFSKSVGT